MFAIFFTLIFVSTVPNASQTRAEEFSWSGAGVLLLSNGNVIKGRQIIPRGATVTVVLDATAQIQMPSNRIVRIGRDERELYLHQVQQTKVWESGDHFQLAKWCLRNGLVDEAYAHYLELRKLSGKHSKFKQYETELRDALLQDPTMKEAIKALMPVAEASNSGKTDKPSSGSGQATKNPPDKPSEISPQLAHILQSSVHQDYFRREIQPFLAMRCGQAGCHGVFGKTNFHAIKAGNFRGRSANDVSLESALKFMLPGKVEDSTLWVRATTRHGNQTAVSLNVENTTERELLERLRRWHHSAFATPISALAAVTGRDASPTPPTMVQPASIMFLNEPSSNVIQASQSTSTVAPDIGGDLLMLEREIAKLEEKEKARKANRDRHDPEEFHRLHANPLRPSSPAPIPDS